MAEVFDRPYEYAAEEWREAGWSPLPLPPREKHEPPKGFTGAAGVEADAQQVTSWIQQHPDSNIALRMPVGVCGIDVDAYKPEGKASWAALNERCGPLPPTWVLTSRTDGESGIRLFRLPAEVKLRGVPAPGIEALQHHHRYAVAWPSIHPSGNMYRLVGPDGDNNCSLPHPDELPELPAPWLDELKEQPRVAGVAAPRRHAGDWSAAVKSAYADGMAGMTKGSRHDTVRDTVAALARLEAQGHPGAADAIDSLGARFTAEIQDRATPQHAEREWRDLLDGARALVASTPSYRSTWDELVPTNGHVNVHDLIVNGASDAGTTPAAALERIVAPVLPESFWAAREAFGHIRQAAHARIRSGDLVLLSVLARLCAYSSHTIQIPPVVGAAGSLNLFVAGIGGSGAGKSSGVAVASELVARPALDVADDMPLGSGEGIAELFMGTEEEEDDKGKKTKVRRQVRFNAFVYGDEGAALNAMSERSGATLPEALRRAWSGAALGQANASVDRTRVIRAGFYRLALVVCFQPELAARLLADADAGTPQRFLWVSAHDPNIPDDIPDWPGPLEVPRIGPNELDARKVTHRGQHHHEITVAGQITAELRTQALQRTRGDATLGQLDSHEPLHLLKTSAALAILDGRLDINTEDWQLAQVIYRTSQRVRATVEAAVAAHIERDKAARIAFQTEREIAVEGARRSVPAQVERIAIRLAKWLHEQNYSGAQPANGWPARDLQRRLAGKEKHLYDAAVAAAIESGWIVENDDGRFVVTDSRPA